jgi:glycosyltransferase involved in cell wall biosynthesis
MNLLFLTEIAPFPPNGGEKIRSYGLLKLMSELNITVHAIIGNAPTDKIEDKNIMGISFYTFNFKRIYSRRRLTNYYRLFSRNKELVVLINNILQNNQIDIVYIDYLFYGQYIGFFRRKNIPVIYGTHNAQARLYYQWPAVSFKNRISQFTDFLLNRFHELYFFRKANAIIVVSENDKNYHQPFIKKDKIFLIPNFLIESEYNCFPHAKQNYILMTANFLAFQNFIGLEWFIREVWDDELWNKTQLYLVGIGSIEICDKLKEKYTLTNVKVFGKVDDLKPIIAAAMISIVPLLHGSGSRLKCLESMALKTQLVSTSKGAEGIDHHNSIIIADKPMDFKKKLLKILDNKTDHTDKAYKAYMEKYSLTSNKTIFANILRNICITCKQ